MTAGLGSRAFQAATSLRKAPQVTPDNNHRDVGDMGAMEAHTRRYASCSPSRVEGVLRIMNAVLQCSRLAVVTCKSENHLREDTSSQHVGMNITQLTKEGSMQVIPAPFAMELGLEVGLSDSIAI